MHLLTYLLGSVITEFVFYKVFMRVLASVCLFVCLCLSICLSVCEQTSSFCQRLIVLLGVKGQRLWSRGCQVLKMQPGTPQ